MPQAPEHMRAKWKDDATAAAFLKPNFNQKGGVIYPRPNYTPTAEDMDAITYLVLEWDYGFTPTEPK